MNPIDYVNTQIVHVQALVERLRHPAPRDERGNVTMEHVLWAGVIVLLVGAVAAVLNGFIDSKLTVLR